MKYSKEQPETISSLFDSIAPCYDRVNTLLSLNQHGRWIRRLVRNLFASSPPHGSHFVDLCAGTGEVARAAAQEMHRPPLAFTLVDFSPEMLRQARSKLPHVLREGDVVQYLECDVASLPLEDNSVDYLSIAYGLRNLKQPKRCLDEIARVLKPKGRFAILELTKPSHMVMQRAQRLYLRTAIPLLKYTLSIDPQPYYYLERSIEQFLSSQEMAHLVEEAPLRITSSTRFFGGIATLLIGGKQRA